MKKTNKIISLVLSICLSLTLLLPLCSPVVSFASNETIFISNSAELIEFAKKCSLDSWSVGKTVILTADISLKDIDFDPIPSFSGIFDGQNHVIGDININGAYSPSGLFAQVGKDGHIKNLTVTGAVTPDGDKAMVGGIAGDNSGKIESCIFIGTIMGKSDVGGIAGINQLSGTITDCQVGGEIIGEKHTGGICGNNTGLISDSRNASKVNTVAVTPEISLDEINVSLTLDITKLPSINNTTMTDAGGISGYSTGLVLGCINDGIIGYPHVGYNIGGIVGRNSGHLSGNKNNAEIYGRKDVGGIVGQMEPYVNYQLSEDLLLSLKAELDRLEDIINGTVENGGSNITNISDRLDSILDNLDDATNSLDSLLGSATDYGSDFIGEINRTSEILTEVISQLAGLGSDVPNLIKYLSQGMTHLENALDDLENISKFGVNSIANLIMVAKETSDAFDKISSSIHTINSGLEKLENSIKIDSKETVESSLDMISDGTGQLLTAVDTMVSAIDGIIDVLDEATWTKDAVEQFGEIADTFSAFSGAISVIYEATTAIKENIDIHWDKIKDGGDELINALNSFQSAMYDISVSLDLMDSGMSKTVEGLQGLYNSVKIKDTEAVNESARKILEGLDELVAASAKGSEALSLLSDAFESLSGDNPSEAISKIADAFEILSKTGTEGTSAFTKLSEGIAVIFENIEIDVDAAEDSGAIIIGGVGDLMDALIKMRSGIHSMNEGMTSMTNAINTIKNSIVINDEEALSNALDSLYDSLGVIVNCVEDFSEIFVKIADTLEDAQVWGENLLDATSDLVNSISLITKSISKIQNGVDSLRENIDINGSLMKEGIALVREGFGELADSAEHLKKALNYLADSLSSLEDAMGGVGSMAANLVQAMISFNDAAEILTDMSSGASKLLNYLAGTDGMQFPVPSENIKSTANKLFISISAIESDLKYLNSDISGISTELLDQIGKINKIFGNITDNIVSIIYGLTDGSLIDSVVTEEQIDSVTNGKIFSCENYGNVYADINVGGIAGTIGLEYTLDPEDDMSLELSVTQKKQYRLKAIIHACKNYGTVTSKRDCAGGIAGKMDFGLIYGAESYCLVQSEGGNYVGGIAGITAGLISQCFVKSTLSGGKYIGGIVGSGVNESISGDSSMVRNNCSMVEIVKYTQYAGAISGANIGQYSENLFISDTLAGIDRVSYQGKAEPITYEQLIKRRSIPQGFYSFVLKFVADGVVLDTKEFKYGESFDNSVFPAIPVKEDHYGYWDRTSLENLTFDITVNVVYKPYVTTIASEEKRENGREIFLIQGMFTEEDKISLTKGADTSNLTLNNRLFTKDSLVESWTIEIPADDLGANKLHILPTNKHARIFLKSNGEWQEFEATTFGSYVVVEVSEGLVELAIIEHTVKVAPIIISSLLLIAIATPIIVITAKKKKQNTKIIVDAKEKSQEK